MTSAQEVFQPVNIPAISFVDRSIFILQTSTLELAVTEVGNTSQYVSLKE
jgi:hypothetical protein